MPLHPQTSQSKPNLPAEFQPDHLGWQVSYDKYFSPSLVATFNSTHYNFTTFKLFYTAVEALVGVQYSDFAINVTNIVAVPDPGSIGGRVYVLGVESGHRRLGGELVSATDGAFAVIGVEGGERKIVEMRESNNFPTG